MKKNIIFILIFTLIIAVCAVVMTKSSIKNASTAVIYSGGKIIKEINLNEINEPVEFDIVSDSGKVNTIRAEKGKIAVTAADCPDKICVNKGFISDASTPVVCLPNKLVVEIKGTKNADAVSGVCR